MLISEGRQTAMDTKFLLKGSASSRIAKNYKIMKRNIELPD